MPKTTYTVDDNKMCFVLPNRTCHQVLACKVDHPVTMTQALDLIAAMSPYERRSVIVMATEYEMESMYPNYKSDTERTQ